MSVVQLGLLLAIFAPFALALWVAYQRGPRASTNRANRPDIVAEFPLTRVSFAAETMEIEPAVRSAADAVHHEARARFVQIELAVRPGTKAHVDPRALRSALHATVLTAVHATPGGQVLITTQTLGSQLHIRITDDGRNADQLTRERQARGAEELIALQGGSIAVEVRSGRGTTVTIRLPLPGDMGDELSDSIEVAAFEDQAA